VSDKETVEEESARDSEKIIMAKSQTQLFMMAAANLVYDPETKSFDRKCLEAMIGVVYEVFDVKELEETARMIDGKMDMAAMLDPTLWNNKYGVANEITESIRAMSEFKSGLAELIEKVDSRMARAIGREKWEAAKAKRIKTGLAPKSTEEVSS